MNLIIASVILYISIFSGVGDMYIPEQDVGHQLQLVVRLSKLRVLVQLPKQYNSNLK